MKPRRKSSWWRRSSGVGYEFYIFPRLACHIPIIKFSGFAKIARKGSYLLLAATIRHRHLIATFPRLANTPPDFHNSAK